MKPSKPSKPTRNAPRNTVVVAMNARHGRAGRMKDRRQTRGGSRDKQRDYREGW